MNAKMDGHDETSAFLVAVRRNDLAMVQYLQEHCGSVVNIEAVDWTYSDKSWAALHTAAEKGNVEMVRYLLRQGTNVNINPNNGSRRTTALYIAADANQEEVVQCLLETGGCDVDAANGNHPYALLSVAIDKRSLTMVRCLLEHYKKAGNMERFRKESQVALYMVCADKDGSLEIAKFLVETCRVDLECTLDNGYEISNHSKGTPLLRACKSGNMDVIQYLEGCGSNVNAKDKDGNTVLHVAVARLEVVRYFVETHGANVEQANNYGETVLSVACECASYSKTLRYLIEECDANVNTTNLDGETLLHIASYHGCLSAAQRVLASGRVVNANAQDKNGQTPLHIACADRRGDLFEMVRFWVDTAGVDLYARDKDGKTALHIAATAATEAAASLTSAKEAAATANVTTAAAATPTWLFVADDADTWRIKQAVKEAADMWRKRYRTVLFLVTSIPIVSDDGDEKAIAMNKRSADPAVGPSSSKRPKL